MSALQCHDYMVTLLQPLLTCALAHHFLVSISKLSPGYLVSRLHHYSPVLSLSLYGESLLYCKIVRVSWLGILLLFSRRIIGNIRTEIQV